MATMNKIQREPAFHIAKRDHVPFWQAVLIRLAAIVCACVVVLILGAILVGGNPFNIFVEMFRGAFISYDVWDLVHEICILLLVALALTPAFKMKFWNIGAQGQILVGGLGCAICMYYGQRLGWGDGLVIILSLLSAVLFGAIWAVIPALFKAFFGTNETLFTLMMNYIAIQCVRSFTNHVKSGMATNPLNTLFVGNLPVVGFEQLLNILIVAIITVMVFVYLRYTKHGYEISVVGDSENSARYAGINVKKVIIRTLILSGMMCGFAAFLLVNGNSHAFSESTEAGRGFTAIIVSWLGKFNPLYMILTSFLVVFLQVGTKNAVDMIPSLKDNSFADITVAVFIIFIIACEFFIAYQIKRRSTGAKLKKTLAKEKE